MYVCALPVLLLFVLHAVIVAVSERVVVVLVRVPVAPMLPLVQGVIGMVVGGVMMVGSMCSRRMGVLRLTPLAFPEPGQLLQWLAAASPLTSVARIDCAARHVRSVQEEQQEAGPVRSWIAT